MADKNADSSRTNATPSHKRKLANNKAKKKAKKKAMKKDEKPPAPIKWADAREPSHDVTADLMRNAAI